MEFAGYVVEGQIGSGSTGVVWLATQVGVDRRVAIKELAADLTSDPAFRERLRAEARVLASLRHPNVVAVYDYVEAANGSYIVEELVDGASLATVVANAGQLSSQQAAGVLRGALSGLAAVHERGLTHGDISPTNILVDRDGTSKLIDFGLASPHGTAGSTGASVYASPEAGRGEPVDARSDVYSAGCVLFELLSGHPALANLRPDTGLSDDRITSDVQLTGPHRQLSGVVTRATAADPADRYPDAAAFLAALEEGAERDLGADWTSKASMAALAATTLTGTGALLVTGSATTSSSASTTAATATASGHAGKIAGFVSHHPVAAAAASIAVVAVGVVAVIASLGGSNPPNPLVGTYNVTRTVTKGNPSSPTGTVDHYVVTISCVGSPCTLRSTVWPNLSADGSEIHVVNDTGSENCTDASGKTTAGTYTQHVVLNAHVVTFATDSSGHTVATRLTGTQVQTVEHENCQNTIVSRLTLKIDATRQVAVKKSAATSP